MALDSGGQLDLGHWFLRLIALLIDGIIIAVVAWVIMSFLIVSIVFTAAIYGFWLGWGYSLVFPFVTGIIMVLYFAFLEVSWGATIGKRVMGLQVQTTSGVRVSFNQAFIRNISKIYWILLFLDWLIAVVTPRSDRRLKYTDRIAGTTVVQVQQAFASFTLPSQ